MHQQIIKISVLWILCLATVIPARSQNEQHLLDPADRYFFKNGIISLYNNFVKERKINKNLLNGDIGPREIHTSLVTGEHTRLSLLVYQANMHMPYAISSLWEDRSFIHQVADLKKLQVRITENGQISQPWKTLDSTALFKDSAVLLHEDDQFSYSFALADLYQQPEDIAVVDVRNGTDSTTVFTWMIRRIFKPVEPMMASMRHDTAGSNRFNEETVKKYLLNKDAELLALEKFYTDKMGGLEYHNTLLFPHSKLIFYFAKARKAFTDSSLEYRFSGSDLKNKEWKRTGHSILIDGLDPGQYYKLEVRYIAYPENIKEYSFFTGLPRYQQPWLRWITGIVLTLITAFLLAFFIYRQRLTAEKKKRSRVAGQLKAIHAQLNPHFIFNSLSSIQALMNKQENTKANQYLSIFAGLMRSVLTNNEKDYISLEQEVKILESYLKLEQLRFNFHYQLNVSSTINTGILMLPPMLLQPLIENAVKHGIPELEEKGYIHVDFTSQQNDLHITVADNGKGFDGKHTSNDVSPREGYGLRLVKEQIAIFNTLHKKQPAQLTIQSAPGAGTTVHLTFKNWLA